LAVYKGADDAGTILYQSDAGQDMSQLPVNPIDLAIIIVMILSAVFSWVRGFTGEVLAVASWVAAAIAAYFLHPWALTYIAPSIANKQIALAASIAAVFLVTLVFVSLITTKLSELILDSAIGTLDRTLGLFFGAARGLLIAVVAFMFFDTLVGEKSQPDMLKDARLRPVLKLASTAIFKALPENPEFLSPFRKVIDENTTKKPVEAPNAGAAPASNTPQSSTPAKAVPAAAAPSAPATTPPATSTPAPAPSPVTIAPAPLTAGGSNSKPVDQQGLQRLIESSTPNPVKR
jgi:membrane protein required for colicin V production